MLRQFYDLHSGKSRTQIYVAQRLNKQTVESHVTRATRIFADARLPRAERGELGDYKNSDLDRGHMAPASNMANGAVAKICFRL